MRAGSKASSRVTGKWAPLAVVMSWLRAVGLAAGWVLLFVAAGPPESPVADAAMRGDAAAVRALLLEGADANTAQGDGMTALHWAAQHGDPELVSVLVAAGAAVNPVTRIGQYTPLHIAARQGHSAVVERLLGSGANIEHKARPSGSTALHLAAGAGATDAMRALLDGGADTNARESRWSQTPLIFAAAANRAAAITLLLERGADPSATTRVEDLVLRGKLDRLARDRYNELIAAFTHDGKRSPTESERQIAIQTAREIQGLDSLPPEGEDEKKDEDEDDDEGPPTPSIENMGGLTALLHAARQGHEAAVLALLNGGANIDQVGAGDGTSPLLMAIINGHFDLAVLFLNRGADVSVASTLNGATPLWAVVNTEWQPRTRYPQPQERSLQRTTYLELMTALLEAGADPNVRLTLHPWYMVYSGCGNRNCGLVDTEGATPFWRAAYATDVTAMRLLVKYGADPNIPTVAPPKRDRLTPDEFLRRQNRTQLTEGFEELADSAKIAALVSVRNDIADSTDAAYEEIQARFTEEILGADPDSARVLILAAAGRADSVRAAEPDPSGLPTIEPGGPGVWPLQAATGVGYGEGFAGNAHRTVQDGWMTAAKYLIEELGVDVNARDHAGYTALHNAASRGDNELILYLMERGADIAVVSRRGQTAADMANGPVQRVSPFPETVALLESLGSVNNHNCVTCE